MATPSAQLAHADGSTLARTSGEVSGGSQGILEVETIFGQRSPLVEKATGESAV